MAEGAERRKCASIKGRRSSVEGERTGGKIAGGGCKQRVVEHATIVRLRRDHFLRAVPPPVVVDRAIGAQRFVCALALCECLPQSSFGTDDKYHVVLPDPLECCIGGYLVQRELAHGRTPVVGNIPVCREMQRIRQGKARLPLQHGTGLG